MNDIAVVMVLFIGLLCLYTLVSGIIKNETNNFIIDHKKRMKFYEEFMIDHNKRMKLYRERFGVGDTIDGEFEPGTQRREASA